MPIEHSTILTKHDLFSYLGLVQAQLLDPSQDFKPVTAVIKLDPREAAPLVKKFETSAEALRNYESAINTSVERGWSVVYRGAPLRG